MQVTFDVYRKDPEPEAKPYRSEYTVELPEDATVIDGLLKIRDEVDPTLAFRASCGRGYCGECTMKVGTKNTFACTAKVQTFGAAGPIALNPIRIVPMVKDLVYDYDAFMWNKIRQTKPWMEGQDSTDGEHVVPDAEMAEVRKTMSCYYCGLCDEGCTALPVDFHFMGPAALTKAARFVFDPRTQDVPERLRILEGAKGIWDCVHCYEADEHCPRGIAPTSQIVALRDEAFKVGITNPSVARHHHSFAASVKESGWVDEARLAIESEGLTNIPGLLKLLPIAIKATVRGKAPLPFLHPKRPGAEHIKRIFQKGERRAK